MDPSNGDVRDTPQGQESYLGGIGWTLIVNMVEIEMVCSKAYGCGKLFTTDEVYPENDVEEMYAKGGRPIPSSCANCDLSIDYDD